MKTVISILLTAACIFFFSFTTSAQKKKAFEGTVTYDITYPNAELTPAMKAMLPTTESVTIKDCKKKTETTNQGATQTLISDGASKTQTFLLDYMGSKYAVKTTSAEITAELAKLPTPVITTTTDTKVIAGYTCKKAILTTTEDDGTVTNDTIFYSDEVGCSDINFDSQYKDIPGTILEYSTYVEQISATMKYVAKEVKKSKISDKEFLIPSDFQEVTKDELKKSLGIE